MKLYKGFLLFAWSFSALLLAGCAVDESKGLCSYLGVCGESADSECEGDDCGESPVKAPAKRKTDTSNTDDSL